MNQVHLSKSVRTNLDNISKAIGDPADLNVEIHGLNDSAGIAYIRGLTDPKDIKANLLQPLIPLLSEPNVTFAKLIGIIPELVPIRVPDLELAVEHLLQGKTVLFLANETEAISFATQG